MVEISHPLVEGPNLVYHYMLIEGPMPKSGEATALHGASPDPDLLYDSDRLLTPTIRD